MAMTTDISVEAAAILWPGDVTPATSARVIGGKALGLARMAAAGARVPAWFVVPVAAFEEHVRRAGLDRRVSSEVSALAGVDPSTAQGRARVESVAAELRAAIEAAPIDARLVALVADAVRCVPGEGPFAVRSSSSDEDSGERSFAGQFDTFLFQRGEGEVVQAIRRCWGSSCTARAIAYRLRTGAGLEAASMAVVVQRMVAGRVSGVLFTANPVNGRRDEAVLTACWGLGEGIVGGACATDEIVLGHDAEERSATIADKDVQVVVGADGRGTREVEVPREMRGARSVSMVEARALLAEGLRLASAFGTPQDIEWTIDDHGIHLLQARPITTLPTPPPVETGARVVWDNSNIQESYCGVTTPLTFSFAARAYATVYEQIIRLLGMPESDLRAQRQALRNLLGLVYGRVYYNINNWYRMLLLSPSFDRNKEDMEKMMGLESPVDFVEDRVLTRREKLAQVPRMARAAASVIREMARLDESVREFEAHFEASMAKLDRSSFAQKSFSELMSIAEWLRTEVVEQWRAPLVNDNFVMTASGRLRRLLARVEPDDALTLWNALVAGEEGIASTEPTRALMRMARAIRGRDDLAAALRDAPVPDALPRLRALSAPLAADLDDYLLRYGDRCMGELKLETRSLRDDPSFVVHVLRNYVARADLDPEVISQKERAARAEAERRVEAKLGALERRRFRKTLTDVRKGVRARESMRLARTRLFGAYRDLYRAAGQRLVEARRLDSVDDVFYVTVEELEAYQEGTAVTTDLASLARLRKAEFARYREIEPPNRFETVGPVYHGNAIVPAQVADEDRAARVLRGVGCSPGVVEAKLRVIHDPHDDLSVSGCILTALRTDPGWAPLFPTAAAVLVERGSTLSHSAVVARELGLAAVVGIPNLLQIVRDGERVRLDGGAGTVERLERA